MTFRTHLNNILYLATQEAFETEIKRIVVKEMELIFRQHEEAFTLIIREAITLAIAEAVKDAKR